MPPTIPLKTSFCLACALKLILPIKPTDKIIITLMKDLKNIISGADIVLLRALTIIAIMLNRTAEANIIEGPRILEVSILFKQSLRDILHAHAS